MRKITVKDNKKNKNQDDLFIRKNAMLVDYTTLSKLIMNDLNKTSSSTKKIFKRYTKNDIRDFLEKPELNEQRLREICIFLYNSSSHFKRLIKYFSGMPTFDYIVSPYSVNFEKVNKKTIKNNYIKTLELLENMNIRHEFKKCLNTAFREDVFYGYIHTTSDSFYIQKLDPDYCQISSIEDGCFNFSFNFNYFDTHRDKLNMYPKEFKLKYKQFIKEKRKSKWIELDSKNTICIKINEDILYPIPPFVGVLESLIEIDSYKALKIAKEEIGNYKLLIHRIPMRKDSDNNNDFSITLDMATIFHNKIADSLPDQVGICTTPMEVEDITFDKDKVGNDNVSQAERDYWNSAGVSQLLFNSDKAQSASLGKSILADEVIIFDILRQFERWLNRYLKLFNFSNKFKLVLLDITYYNQKDVVDQLLKSAQYSMPVKTRLCSALGLSPLEMYNMIYWENEILELHDNLIPLSSSHVQSNSLNEGGRPPINDGDLTEQGQKTRNNDSNSNTKEK